MANIYESTIEERELLDNKLVEFNRKKVPFLQSEDWSVLSYALKDETGQAIAGINSMLYCWNILYVDILYVEDPHRGKRFMICVSTAVLELNLCWGWRYSSSNGNCQWESI